MLEKILREDYGLHPAAIARSTLGAGSDTYFVDCEEGSFVLKFPHADAVNHPEREGALCEFLLKKGIPVSRFLRNREGSFLTRDDAGRLCTLQIRLPGKTPAWNTASDALLWEQAELLGKIHAALRDHPALPMGIGADFFRLMTPQRAKESYTRSLSMAIKACDRMAEDDLRFRIRLMDVYPARDFAPEDLSCGATHGDYNISQLLCSDERICGVIDWTCACVHPFIWELARSYAYAAPECAEGVFDDARFAAYMAHYARYSPLNAEDRRCAKALYCYQIAVCDYYGQYYSASAANRAIFMKQARLATKLLRREFSTRIR